MKALLLSDYKHLEIAELPLPTAGPGEVLVRVAACAICGSDVHGYDGSSGRRIPPIVMGHEAAGRIAVTGAGVTGFAEGDRVTFDSSYLSSHDPREVLGIGKRTRIDKLEIHWPQPSGRMETFTDLPIDRYITIVEGSGIQ